MLDGLEDCPQLCGIIAADNQIATVGDLRTLSSLRSLDLRGNALTSIAALPHHLPAALSSLDVANNELSNLSDLRYVSSLMELRRLDLRANPLTSMALMQVFDVLLLVLYTHMHAHTCASMYEWRLYAFNILWLKPQGHIAEDMYYVI